MDMKKQLEANLLKCLQRLHIEYRHRIIQQGSHFSGGGGMIGAKSSGTTAAINSTMHNHDNEITEELFTLIHTINTTVPLPINNHGGVPASSPQGGQSKRQKKRRSKAKQLVNNTAQNLFQVTWHKIIEPREKDLEALSSIMQGQEGTLTTETEAAGGGGEKEQLLASDLSALPSNNAFLPLSSTHYSSREDIYVAALASALHSLETGFYANNEQEMASVRSFLQGFKYGLQQYQKGARNSSGGKKESSEGSGSNNLGRDGNGNEQELMMESLDGLLVDMPSHQQWVDSIRQIDLEYANDASKDRTQDGGSVDHRTRQYLLLKGSVERFLTALGAQGEQRRVERASLGRDGKADKDGEAEREVGTIDSAMQGMHLGVNSTTTTTTAATAASYEEGSGSTVLENEESLTDMDNMLGATDQVEDTDFSSLWQVMKQSGHLYEFAPILQSITPDPAVVMGAMGQLIGTKESSLFVEKRGDWSDIDPEVDHEQRRQFYSDLEGERLSRPEYEVAARLVGLYPSPFLDSLPSSGALVEENELQMTVEYLCFKLVAVGRFEKVSRVLSHLRRGWSDRYNDKDTMLRSEYALGQRAYLSDLGYRLALVMTHPRINCIQMGSIHASEIAMNYKHALECCDGYTPPSHSATPEGVNLGLLNVQRKRLLLNRYHWHRVKNFVDRQKWQLGYQLVDQYHQRNQRDKKEMAKEHKGHVISDDRPTTGTIGQNRLSIHDVELFDLPGKFYRYLKEKEMFMEAETVYEDYHMHKRPSPGTHGENNHEHGLHLRDRNELYAYQCAVSAVTPEELQSHRQRIESTYMPLPLVTDRYASLQDARDGTIQVMMVNDMDSLLYAEENLPSGGGTPGGGGSGGEYSFVGVDSEWLALATSGNNAKMTTPGANLLQIATKDRVFLFDLDALGRGHTAKKSTGRKKTGSTEVNPDSNEKEGDDKKPEDITISATIRVLSNLFGDRGVVKVGWGFDKGDITMLKAAANGAFEEAFEQVQSLLDLNRVVVTSYVSTKQESIYKPVTVYPYSEGTREKRDSYVPNTSINGGSPDGSTSGSTDAKEVKEASGGILDAFLGAALPSAPTQKGRDSHSTLGVSPSRAGGRGYRVGNVRPLWDQGPRGGEMGLSTAVEMLLGRPLLKSDQTSDWTKRPLTSSQLTYAANDAYILLAILDIMLLDYHALVHSNPRINTRVGRYRVPDKVGVYEKYASYMGAEHLKSHDTLDSPMAPSSGAGGSDIMDGLSLKDTYLAIVGEEEKGRGRVLPLQAWFYENANR